MNQFAEREGTDMQQTYTEMVSAVTKSAKEWRLLSVQSNDKTIDNSELFTSCQRLKQHLKEFEEKFKPLRQQLAKLAKSEFVLNIDSGAIIAAIEVTQKGEPLDLEVATLLSMTLSETEMKNDLFREMQELADQQMRQNQMMAMGVESERVRPNFKSALEQNNRSNNPSGSELRQQGYRGLFGSSFQGTERTNIKLQNRSFNTGKSIPTLTSKNNILQSTEQSMVEQEFKRRAMPSLKGTQKAQQFPSQPKSNLFNIYRPITVPRLPTETRLPIEVSRKELEKDIFENDNSNSQTPELLLERLESDNIYNSSGKTPSRSPTKTAQPQYQSVLSQVSAQAPPAPKPRPQLELKKDRSIDSSRASVLRTLEKTVTIKNLQIDYTKFRKIMYSYVNSPQKITRFNFKSNVFQIDPIQLLKEIFQRPTIVHYTVDLTDNEMLEGELETSGIADLKAKNITVLI